MSAREVASEWITSASDAESIHKCLRESPARSLALFAVASHIQAKLRFRIRPDWVVKPQAVFNRTAPPHTAEERLVNVENHGRCMPVSRNNSTPVPLAMSSSTLAEVEKREINVHYELE